MKPYELFETEASADSPCAVFLSASGSDENAPVREKLFGRIGDGFRLFWFELDPGSLADAAELARAVAAEISRGAPGQKISIISHGEAAAVCHALAVTPGLAIHRTAFIGPVIAGEPDYGAYKQIPMLIVQGTHDSVAPWSENGRRLLEGSADVTVEFVPGAGHWPHRESERATWQSVIGFLRDEYPVFVSDENAGTQVIELE